MKNNNKTILGLAGAAFIVTLAAQLTYYEYKEAKPDYVITLTKIKHKPVLPELKARPAVLKPAPKMKTYLSEADYWKKVANIESKNGKLKYRKPWHKGCKKTVRPCGKYQIDARSLKDIKWKGPLSDRDNDIKALKMAKLIRAKKLKRLNITEAHLKYLLHQQGANGLKTILLASKGKKVLPRKIVRNMANNSPWSFKKLNSWKSSYAANKFLKHWETRFNKA